MTYKIGDNIPAIPDIEEKEEKILPIIIGPVDNPIFSGSTCVSKYQEPDYDSAREEVWNLIKIISKMSRPDIHECFCVPAKEVVNLSYAEAKTRYDAWTVERENM